MVKTNHFAIKSKTPVVAFTAPRWGTFLEGDAGWSDEPPTAADCYRYCLAQAAVHVVLTAAKSLPELEGNLAVLKLPNLNRKDRSQWERFGDLVYKRSGSTADYESRWP